MNEVFISGKIGGAVKMFYTERGLCIARFPVKVHKNLRKNAPPEAVPYDTFFCVAFGKIGELLGNCSKEDDEVMIKGKLSLASYENKEGQKVYQTEVQVHDLEFLESHKSSSPSATDDFSSLGVEVPF